MGQPDIIRYRLNPRDRRAEFSCGDEDLDEFYRIDSSAYSLQFLAVTYVFELDGKIVAYLSLSNDAIRRVGVEDKAFNRAMSDIPESKHYPSMPAVKIGRFGVSNMLQRSGIGTVVMDYIKMEFCSGTNKTGCRFLVVDAYANSVGFYRNNGFEFLSSRDRNSETRIMYFDLMQFAHLIKAYQ